MNNEVQEPGKAHAASAHVRWQDQSCGMFWVDLHAPERSAEVLIPETYECGLIWNLSLYQWNQAKMGSYWISALIQCEWCSYNRRRKNTGTEARGKQAT